MTCTLEGKVATINDLAWIEAQLGIFTLTACRNTVCQLTFPITFWQRRLVVGSVVPDNVARRHVSSCSKAEFDGAREGIEELIMVLSILHIDFVRQAQIEEFMHSIEQMCTPVTKRSHSEVVPTTPITLVIELAEVVVANASMPSIIIHTFRNWIAFRHLSHVPIVLVPTTIVVHVSNNFGHILDDASFLPSFELEIVAFRVSLIANLSCKFWVTIRHFDEDFTFLESTDERLLAINMLAMLHSSHADKEVSVVRNADCNCIEMVAILFEKLAEISITLCIRIHVQGLLTLLALQVDIAKSYDIHHVCLSELVDVLLSTIANTNVGNSNFLVLGFHSSLNFLLFSSQHLAWSQGQTSRSKAHTLNEISSC